MTKPRLILTLPDTDKPDRFVPLVILLQSLVDINEYHLRRAIAYGKPYPRLYDSGVVYKEEAPGREDWPDVPRILTQGWGDCEDLAAYLAAERRVYDNLDCNAIIKWKWIPTTKMISAGWDKKKLPRDGVWLVHCLVEHADGRIEDPSKVLGMGGNYTDTL